MGNQANFATFAFLEYSSFYSNSEPFQAGLILNHKFLYLLLLPMNGDLFLPKQVSMQIIVR